ncbi:MAG: dihydrolipoamide acetyltransferase family protein [Ilumatobacteraceae bacterium]|nr:dihydrolipoamide acetyltransferase family protein [Ilumatobacteraceae bacterium]
MTYTMRLPDVGEGVAEAELIEWLVAVGDEVTPDSALVEVLTDKATVEVSCPVSGVVTALHGEPGDTLAVGSDLIEIDTGDSPTAPPDPEVEPAEPDVDAGGDTSDAGTPLDPPVPPADAPEGDSESATELPAPPPAPSGHPAGARASAAPAVRRRARGLGVDLGSVPGTGPDGRVVHADLDRMIAGGSGARPLAGGTGSADDRHPEPVRGIRRRIAERLTAAWTEIPHITYVESVDVTELERLRAELNRQGEQHAADRLTMLPFLAVALAIACSEQPTINAHYDHAEQVLTRFDGVHIGIATQTDGGLLVPVVRHAEARRLRDLAAEIARVTEAARDGSATRDELSGSTITITSLGAIGGVTTTPILNAPEVAIVGVNKIETRPVWHGDRFEPRQVLNLSSSFDHRMVDGWDAATFVQRIKTLLETPALLFVDD